MSLSALIHPAKAGCNREDTAGFGPSAMREQDASAIFRGPHRLPAGWCCAALLLCVTGAISAQPSATGTFANPRANPRATNPLNTAWQAVGPVNVASQNFGTVTGRVTSIAIDPADSSGNTVYLGTTGGGVWKSTNAGGRAASVTFKPLTDTLPVFSANAGTAAIPSLSIGALSISQTNGIDVLLAGTGDPNNALDSYYGEGILRSTDGGSTWSLAQQANDGVAGNHTFVGLSVAGFAWSTTTPGLVVAAMSQSAEGVLVNATDANYSVMGLYYSTNGGVSWQMGLVMDGSQVLQRPTPGGAPGNAATAVVWNPVRQMFYAAIRYHGYYSSPDGISWTRLTLQPGAGLTTTACPTNPNGVGSTSCPIFRGTLAVQPNTGDTFALTVDANNLDQGLWQDVCALMGARCATAAITFGKKLTSTQLEVGNGSTAIAQGDYNLSLAAVQAGTGTGLDTLLFAGTVDLYRCSLAAGCALRNTTNAQNGCNAPAMVSPAQHAIATLSNAGTGGTLPMLYVGNDGGLWRSSDGVNQQQTPCSPDDATHFQNLNSGLGSLAEVVSFAQNPTDPATLLAGLGANGTAATGGANIAPAWPQIATGEGGPVAIDQVNAQNWYVSTEAGVSIRYCGNGNVCAATNFSGSPTLGYAQVDKDASLIDPPFLLDPALTSDVLIGSCRVWRGLADSTSAWPGSNNISSAFDGSNSTSCSTTDAMVRSLAAGGPASGAIAAQDAGSTVLYAGMAGTLDGGANFGGHIFANYAAATSGSNTLWTDVAKSTVTNDTADAHVFNPGGFDISSVVTDPHDATGKTVYAAVTGFAGNGVNAPHVYRSINGGASWSNISSNLPNAPANAVLVDPNDANTLYVAMDDGVYETTAVSTCATASVSCWSLYGISLPNAPVVGLQAASGMATGDGRFGELRAATYGRGIWEIPLLTAALPATPGMTFSPVSLIFSAQAISSASAAQSITVTNSGNAPLTVTQVVTSGDFNQTSNCIGLAIAVGTGCAVQVQFLPTAMGTRSGLLTVYGNVSGGQATAVLTGTGTTAASIVLDPITLSFASTNVGAISIAQNITISNTGGVPATLGTPTVTTGFAIIANTCGASLAPSVGCTVSVAFQPTASGTLNGSLSITDSAGVQSASLIGLGVLPATDGLSPSSLVFAAQQLNTASASKQVTLTNAGDSALLLISAQSTSGNFTVVNSCGNSLIGHSMCSLLVTYVPTSLGPETGVLIVADQYRSQTVNLSGSGVAPPGVSLSPVSSVAFGPTGVGLTAASQTVTLTNDGGLPLSIASIAVTGDFAVMTGSNTCGTSLAVGSQCTLQLAFAPSASAARTGSLTVTDNAASSPQSLQLTGTGVDFTLTANGSSTQSISAGLEAVYPLLLSSAAGVPGTVAFACTGVPANAACVVNPSTSALGGTATITVTVATSFASLHMPQLPGNDPMTWLVFLLPVGLLGLRGGGARQMLAIATLCCLVLIAGCGSSRMIPATTGGSSTNPVTPTPSGTYIIVVSGTSAGLTRSINLSLIVQ